MNGCGKRRLMTMITVMAVTDLMTRLRVDDADDDNDGYDIDNVDEDDNDNDKEMTINWCVDDQ